MQALSINYLAVLVSAVASMILGSLWYGPVFGKPWMKEMGMTHESMKAMPKGAMNKLYAIQFVGSLVMAWVLAHAVIFAGYYMQTGGFSSGLMTGFMSWLGFVAPVTLTSVLWEQKSWKLWILNNGYYLLLLLIMGAILGAWM